MCNNNILLNVNLSYLLTILLLYSFHFIIIIFFLLNHILSTVSLNERSSASSLSEATSSLIPLIVEPWSPALSLIVGSWTTFLKIVVVSKFSEFISDSSGFSSSSLRIWSFFLLFFFFYYVSKWHVFHINIIHFRWEDFGFKVKC